MSTQPRLVEVRQQVLKQNDLAARALRQRFQEAGVYVVSLVSGPGTGKTTFLEKVLGAVSLRYRVAALVGDLATDNDAKRLAGACSDPANYDRDGVPPGGRNGPAGVGGMGRRQTRLFVHRKCRQSRLPLQLRPRREPSPGALSVTEGEDKPLKYPSIFNTADVAVLTKIDLAAAVEFDRAAAHRSIQSVRPGMQVFEFSAKTGAGMEEWLRFLSHTSSNSGGRADRKQRFQPRPDASNGTTSRGPKILRP